MLAAVVALAVSAIACHLIVRSSGWHLRFTADRPGAQPQKFHSQAVPRIGGLALLLGMAAAGTLVALSGAELRTFWWLMLSLLPAFLGGFAEDVTGRVGPAARLALTVVTAMCAFSLAGAHFTRSDVDWLDAAIGFAPVGYVMLLFAVAGVAHAVNIIDGYHGLAGGVATCILLAMGDVALQSGDTLVASVCWTTAGATLGFLLLNYPSGRLFLGDGGAYLLGCAIALAAVLLVQRNPGVSPWFPMALAVYPVWETLFSIARRLLVYRTHVGKADARHLHSLVYRAFATHGVTGDDAAARTRRSALTTLPFWAANAVIAVLAVQWADSSPKLGLLVCSFIAGYCILYWRLALPAGPAGRGVTANLKPVELEPDAE